MVYSREDIIRQVKESVKVPVMGNGDVFSVEDSIKIKKETNCDAIMVARGCMGNPWIFTELSALYKGEKFIPPSFEDRKKTLLLHLRKEIALLGEFKAIRLMRRFASYYVKGIRGASSFRNRIMEIDCSRELTQLIETFFEKEIASSDGRRLSP